MKTKPCPYCAGSGRVHDDIALGLEMKRLRTKAGLKLKDIAAKVGKTVSYISDMEHGRRRWTPEMELKVLHAIGTLPSPEQPTR